MATVADDPMWSMVMFDLPVTGKAQQREANRFRNALLDSGYTMLQFSVYVRFLPAGGQNHATISRIKRELPHGGEVRIYHLTDRQWSTAFRFVSAVQQEADTTPTQLAFF